MGNKTFSIRPFDKLRKTIEQRETAAAPAQQRQKKKSEYTDDELFSREMNGVHEIESFRLLACEHHPRKRAPGGGRRDPDQDVVELLGKIAHGQEPIHLPDTQEYVQWVNPEYHDTIIPRLHEGGFAVQAFLDLHGCDVCEAEEELDAFIGHSCKNGLRCIKIIHGRGLRSRKGPRLKDAVVRRLSGHFRKEVIAFVTARQCDGGLGALYVLLQRK